jgi:hypothetical protein
MLVHPVQGERFVGGLWQTWWMTRAALRRAVATIGVVATLAAMAPPALAVALPDGTTGSSQSADVNQNAVEPKAPRQHDISAPAPSRDKLGPTPQPAAITAARIAQPITTTPRPAVTARATNLAAAAATIAAQPRAPPLSRT